MILPRLSNGENGWKERKIKKHAIRNPTRRSIFLEWGFSMPSRGAENTKLNQKSKKLKNNGKW
jgi:hypothetical protein